MYRTAEIVVVGSEFFSRDKRDTNSIWLTEELEKRGVRVLSKSIVTDDLEELTRVIRHGLEAVDFVVSTGGLGPTEDDRTRDAVSRALGLELRFQQEIADEIEQRFTRRGRLMSENNRRQAYIPEHSEVVRNETGTAPGFYCQTQKGSFLALPGPPREMQGMFLRFLVDHSSELPTDSQVTARRTLRVSGLGESDMDRKISDLYKDLTNPEVTINFTPHDLEIHLTARAGDLDQAEALIDPLAYSIEERLEGFLFSAADQSLAEVVVGELKKSGLKLAVTESITGGHVAHEICSVPGASEVFLGSIVAYTEGCKMGLLGVSPETLAEKTPVSEEVALEMLKGLKQRTGADVCLSCTGYAGPGGGTERDPVGTVYVGFLTPERESVRRISLPGSRNLVRSRATQAMLFMLFRYLRKRN
jgi:competence/damage-inducible protein CinA-like protein